jgi:hypothetical protein
VNEAFIKWKKGFMRKDKNNGKIFFCSPDHAKKCLSSFKGLTECVGDGSCDRIWREETKYFGKMIDENDVIKEMVQFT